MNEARLQHDVLAALGALPGVLIMRNTVGRVQVDGRWQSFGLGPGTPDLVGAVDGRMFGLELKSAKGRVGVGQTFCHEAWRRAGVVVEVVRSVDEARAVVERARGGGR